jgi:two-component system, OmpR family, response regulator
MPSGPESVLLVEDDPAIAELYALKLRLDGYLVHLAADGATAEVIFERARPEVVCVDTRLPDASGRLFASRFANAGAQVIMLTNDQGSYEAPPPGVSRSMLKSRTSPSQLSDAITQLIQPARDKNGHKKS